MDRLQWMFELLDKVTGPATKIEKAFSRIETAAKKVESPKQLSSFSRAVQAIGNTFGPKAAAGVLSVAKGFVALEGPIKEGTALVGQAAMTLGGLLLPVLGAVVAGGIGLATFGTKWAIGALSFKENTLAAFKAMLGSEEAAQRVFAQATKFAAETPFETPEVIDAFKRLLTAGFKEVDLSKLMAAAGDVGALMGVDKMNQVITALSQIKAKGKLSAEELMQLAEAGVGQTAVFEALAKTLGKTTQEVQALISAGKISGDQGVQAVVDAIASSLSGGQLGDAMKTQGRTLSGLWSTLLSAPFDLLMAANMGGMLDRIKDFIEAITNALKPDTATGQRIIALFEKIGNAISKIFGLSEGADVEGFFGKILDVVEPIVDALISFGSGWWEGIQFGLSMIVGLFEDLTKDPELIATIVSLFGTFGKIVSTIMGTGLMMSAAWLRVVIGAFQVAAVVIGALIDTILFFVDLISEPLTMAIEFASEILTKFFSSENGMDLALDLITGLVMGIFGGGPAIADALINLAASAASSFASALGIASPSKVFEDLGKNTGLGFIQGLAGSGAGDAASGAGIKAPGPSDTVAASAGIRPSGGGTVINIAAGAVVLNISGVDAKDAGSVGAAAQRGSQEGIAAALRKFALEAG